MLYYFGRPGNTRAAGFVPLGSLVVLLHGDGYFLQSSFTYAKNTGSSYTGAAFGRLFKTRGYECDGLYRLQFFDDKFQFVVAVHGTGNGW